MMPSYTYSLPCNASYDAEAGNSPEAPTPPRILQELHAHLNGSISPNTMEKLLKRHEEKLKPDGDSSSQGVPELWQTTVTKWDEKNKSELPAVVWFNCCVIFTLVSLASLAHHGDWSLSPHGLL